jgi:threonine dehydratase
MVNVPSIKDILAARERLAPYIVETPLLSWKGEAAETILGRGGEIVFKLELFQKTGTFKPRGALTVMLNLPKAALAKGVTAVSAGNHAIAVAYAAEALGVSAKIVMKKGANRYRVGIVEGFGAELVWAKDFHQAFAEAERIQKEEGRAYIHPFEGPHTFLGTATLGLEWAQQAGPMDAAIIAIGGGGLCSGVSLALKQKFPNIEIYGVEPLGADTMFRSFRSGEPETIPEIKTIADSLGAPMSCAQGVEVCRRYVREVMRISDEEMVEGMRFLLEELKLAVEPGGAASTAAMTGVLRERLQGKRVGVLICGSNISAEDFCHCLAGGNP